MSQTVTITFSTLNGIGGKAYAKNPLDGGKLLDKIYAHSGAVLSISNEDLSLIKSVILDQIAEFKENEEEEKNEGNIDGADYWRGYGKERQALLQSLQALPLMDTYTILIDDTP